MSFDKREFLDTKDNFPKRKPKTKTKGLRKSFGRIAFIAYLILQSYIFIKYASRQDGELLSALPPLLSDFKGSSTTNGPHLNDGKRFESIEAGKEKVPKVSVNEYNNPLERDFSRIPGYLEGSNNPSLFGYVMRDLSNRFLKPSSAQQRRRNLIDGGFSPSDILVVCPRASAILSEIKEKTPVTIASKKELIKRFGYGIGESFLVESIFYGHNVIAVDSDTNSLEDDGSKTNDILLAIFDPAKGQEDRVITSRLEEYIRRGAIQFSTFRISGSLSETGPIDNLAATRNHTQMQGVETARKFLQAGYKLQVLSSSHAPRRSLDPYGPNTLLKDVEDVEGFLTFGAKLAKRSENVRYSKRKAGNLTISFKTTVTPATFHSILFATRSLDLAIPSRNVFLNLTGHGSDFVLDIENDGVPYLECPKSFLTATETENDEFEISCYGVSLTMHESGRRRVEDGNTKTDFELWHSHDDISLSEAVCFKCTKSSIHFARDRISDSLCINRIPSTTRKSSYPSGLSGGKFRGPNLLAIELKGVNQIMLNSTLGRFKSFSGSMGLDYFPNCFESATTFNYNDDKKWWKLWDSVVVEGDGYQRYRGSNQCDLSSQSTSDNSTLLQGSQMGRMFCFDYDRPNCIGGVPAATHLLNHVKKFIRHNQKRKERWVSYVTLIDGLEETETLSGALEVPLSDFLSDVKAQMTFEEWSNTVITIFSKDVQRPILFLKADNRATELLRKQKAVFTSDLHLIVRSVMNAQDLELATPAEIMPEHTNMQARPFLLEGRERDWPKKGELEAPPSVLSFYADIPKEQKFQLIKAYSGQPTKRAEVFDGCHCTTNALTRIPCDIHPWETGLRDPKVNFILVDCPGRPLHLEIDVIPYKRLLERSLKKKKQSSSSHLENVNIIFLELDSVSQEYADRHFPKTRELLEKYRIKRNDESRFECTDGICSAEFPYTALVGANSVPNQVAALSGCITSTIQEDCGLNLTSALPGEICNDANAIHYGFRLERVRRSSKMAYWCPDRDLEVTKTPWIFGVSDSKGFINFFGEEFCYEDSPYVTQENVFPKFYLDIQSHKVFCSLVERKVATVPGLRGAHRKHWWGVDLSDPCIDGYTCPTSSEKSTISLQFIEQVWNAYDTTPKLAFLNAMAAHDYSADWEMMIPRAELYDEHIHKFLERMLSRKDSQRTVVILRSDHGLQKGPMSTDFSLQVEHRHPWTEILVPENLIASKKALFDNQSRMLTGYDLYKTMRFLMSDRSSPQTAGEGIPSWSFDLLSEEIFKNRTCQEAKIDSSLCPDVKQTRQYGVCNRLDPGQARFCEIKR